MFLTERKFEARINELANYRYRDAIKINRFSCSEDNGEIGTYPFEFGGGHVMNIGDKWKGRDLYLWLHADVTIPMEWQGRKVVGLFDFGRTGGGNNSGFESLLFVNGDPYQGVDSNHQEVFFQEEFSGKKVSLDFRLWSGLEGGGEPREQEYTLETSQLAWLDEAVDDLYFSSLAMYQTIMELSNERPEKQQLTSCLNEVFQIINWGEPGSHEFYQSCHLAQQHLRQRIEQFEKHSNVTVHCVGHTHIDVAWLWRLKHTREKATRSFSTVLKLMEQFPDYLFLQTQPQLYEYIKEDYPEVYQKIRERIKEGRWEAEGAMWLEADCNIPSGEALVRQILYGKKFLREEFDIDCQYLWLPDVFGYSWALPQILRKSGLKTFMTTKISWNQYNRMPHDTFTWRGIDGSEILTHFITTPEPWNPEDSWFYTYNGLVTAKTVNGSWKSYRNKEINQDLLLSYGYGDGGGGVNREMLELRRRLDEMPGLPHVKTTTAKDYFNLLHKKVENTNEYIHTWDGELYLEYHRGTYTSQAHNKRMNRKLELRYREAEWLSVWNGLENGWQQKHKQKLDEGWKIILRNQFHDIIPGSSIREVYEDSRIEYEQAEAIGHEVASDAIKGLVTETTGSFTLFNSSQWKNNRTVQIPYSDTTREAGVWKTDEHGNLSAQKTEDGWIVGLPEVRAFGVTNLQFVKGTRGESNSPFSYNNRQLETPFYTILWNENGQITRLFDKQAGREVLSQNEIGNVLQVFEDKPLAHDAWDIDIFYQEKMEEVRELESIELVENGPVRAVLRLKWSYRDSSLEQDVMVYADHRRIDFESTIDWHEQRKLLKVCFPVDIRSTEATFDIQYGNVKRPTHWNTSWDMARFETVGHQWADLSETGYGVSLLNDCKYGYDIKDHYMRLSLIKSAIHPDPQADQGHHVFTYSLFPHEGDWKEAGTVEEAWFLNNPITVAWGAFPLENHSWLEVDGDHVIIDAIKQEENGEGIVIRLHEYKGKRGNVHLKLAMPFEKWVETDLMEKPIGNEQMGSIELSLKPYEIKTLVIFS
ncbi:alpha-mannosidase [Bacillus pakistanensis]|uniref:Alpha-mannosidase n=1 Tax=Rossellomorea pakistanensis TaxID=992288 RepID=A0ABS2NCL8_9BACI|nr:alpha-mannosidase [Bacillus pakistanensis]MBM7585599.1 alpha-mannosidase [Bacillus pakistanensis]